MMVDILAELREVFEQKRESWPALEQRLAAWACPLVYFTAAAAAKTFYPEIYNGISFPVYIQQQGQKDLEYYAQKANKKATYVEDYLLLATAMKEIYPAFFSRHPIPDGLRALFAKDVLAKETVAIENYLSTYALARAFGDEQLLAQAHLCSNIEERVSCELEQHRLLPVQKGVLVSQLYVSYPNASIAFSRTDWERIKEELCCMNSFFLFLVTTKSIIHLKVDDAVAGKTFFEDGQATKQFARQGYAHGYTKILKSRHPPKC